MKSDNTIVTIGDINYLWGIFMLLASARKAGMDTPFLVGTKAFTPRADRVLTQLGGVTLLPLDTAGRSLTCLKAKAMLQARTQYVTWADSDAFFTGDVAALLPPSSPELAHFRLRAPDEMPQAFKGRSFGEDGRSIPQAVLAAWRRDVAEVAGEARQAPRQTTTGSAAFFALSLDRHGKFLEIWDALQSKVLPQHDVGVVDRSLKFYHQLDESTLNACLNFVIDAPEIEQTYRLNKDRSRLFAHFIAQPKPWVGWTKSSFRFFDEYVAVAEWAAAQGLELPGPMPECLKAGNKNRCRALIPWTTLKPKILRRLKKLF